MEFPEQASVQHRRSESFVELLDPPGTLFGRLPRQVNVIDRNSNEVVGGFASAIEGVAVLFNKDHSHVKRRKIIKPRDCFRQSLLVLRLKRSDGMIDCPKWHGRPPLRKDCFRDFFLSISVGPDLAVASRRGRY